MDWPLAFHLTFGTYGTRLHGDSRGTVDREHNRFGDPYIGDDEQWEREEPHLLKYPPVILTTTDQRFIQQTLPAICARGKWEFHTSAAAPDHVHVLLLTESDPHAVRKWLKRWISEALCARSPQHGSRPWWAECGSVKWVWDDRYLQAAYEYITGQRCAG